MSWTSAVGSAPSVLSKLCSVVSVPAGVILKTAGRPNCEFLGKSFADSNASFHQPRNLLRSLNFVNLQLQFCVRLALTGNGNIEPFQFGHKN